MLPEGFVYIKDIIPSVREDIRYAGDHNFVGCPVDGYFAPKSVLKEEAALALKKAAEEFEKQGLYLLIYDAYRPQRAVDHFVRWAKDESDIKMKEEFYPELDKSELFPKGYIAVYSGHSRGLTVDLTLVDREGNELDMGGEFDWFSRISSHDYEIVNTVANRVIELTPDGWQDFHGTYEEFVEHQKKKGITGISL